MASLVVGEGLLGDAEVIADLLLCEVPGFPGLCDPGSQGLEELLVLAVHGRPDRGENSHEDKLQFLRRV